MHYLTIHEKVLYRNYIEQSHNPTGYYGKCSENENSYIVKLIKDTMNIRQNLVHFLYIINTFLQTWTNVI